MTMHHHGQHNGSQTVILSPNAKKIALIGNPNTGKSVMFNNLTGTYVTVSNYPGTTVDVTRGSSKLFDYEVEVVDTPGMYSLSSITEEEKVARKILLDEKPDLVLHLVDAKNLDRMLHLTLQILEAELPLILILNFMDEAEEAGIKIDPRKLESELGIPVVPTVATSGRGMNDLIKTIEERLDSRTNIVIKSVYSKPLESAINEITSLLARASLWVVI